MHLRVDLIPEPNADLMAPEDCPPFNVAVTEETQLCRTSAEPPGRTRGMCCNLNVWLLLKGMKETRPVVLATAWDCSSG